jgi:arylsulfatase A-like enzyme
MKKLLFSAALALCAMSQSIAATKRPNIILFLADDMGYGNVGANGNADVATPNIDTLATGGLRFTDAHSPAAVCQPTRYSILAGRYYFRSVWGRIQSGIYFRENEKLLPQLLKDSGYATAMFGKWHLGFGLTKRGEETDWNGDLKPGPNECGFDYWFGMPNSHAQPPYVFIENHGIYRGDPADPIKILSSDEAKAQGIKPPAGAPTGWGVSVGAKAAHEACDMNRLDLIMADKACEFIGKQSPEKPFFIYLPFFAPHVPLAVAEEFRGKSPIAARLKKQNNNAIRTADYCQQLDHAVGMVLACLKERGFADNTLVVFTSDNGNLNFGDNVNVGFRTNGPFNGQKADVWEGGHRVPCIARWPGKIPAGKSTDKLFSLTDLYGTFLAAADVPVPAGAGPDSANMLPLLEHPDTAPGRTAMVYRGKAAALRIGDWAYHPQQGPGGLFSEGPVVRLGYSNSDYDETGKIKPDAPPAQLYNLREDPAQTVNLYNKEPELVAAMDDIAKRFYAAAKKGDEPLESFLVGLPPEIARKLNLPPAAK